MKTFSFQCLGLVLCLVSTAAAQTPSESVFVLTPPIQSVNQTDTYPSAFSPAASVLDVQEKEYGYSSLAPTHNSGGLYLSRIPDNQRTGMFQKANFNTLWIPANGGNNALGLTQLDISATFALPMPKPDSPLVITPSFQTTFFDTKRAGGETFYKTGVDFRWIRPVFPKKLTADIGVGIFYSGDLKATGSDAVQVPMHLAGIWNYNPRLKIIFGVVYLDRNDSYNWLPMAGLIWTPEENLSVELVFPKLRIAQRVNWFGTGGNPAKSDWFYGAFEFSGGSWGYEPVSGVNGTLEYRDMRLLVGVERKTSGGFNIGFETGYVFARKLEGFGGTYDAADSLFLRLRTSY
ncbi:hypothetical protein FACS189419_03950 [Planctomycetales bacterium]|nr:hypothetical protein FACS189419_03950 [Planctomycetales bacterium]